MGHRLAARSDLEPALLTAAVSSVRSVHSDGTIVLRMCGQLGLDRPNHLAVPADHPPRRRGHARLGRSD